MYALVVVSSLFAMEGIFSGKFMTEIGAFMPSYSVAGHFFLQVSVSCQFFLIQVLKKIKVFDFFKPLNLLISLFLSFRMKSNKEVLESNFSVVGK